MTLSVTLAKMTYICKLHGKEGGEGGFSSFSEAPLWIMRTEGGGVVVVQIAGRMAHRKTGGEEKEDIAA